MPSHFPGSHPRAPRSARRLLPPAPLVPSSGARKRRNRSDSLGSPAWRQTLSKCCAGVRSPQARGLSSSSHFTGEVTEARSRSKLLCRGMTRRPRTRTKCAGLWRSPKGGLGVGEERAEVPRSSRQRHKLGSPCDLSTPAGRDRAHIYMGVIESFI